MRVVYKLARRKGSGQMAFESKALIISIFNYVKKMNIDEQGKMELLIYLQQLANADSTIVELPEQKKAGE
jgi:hypothetical protein